MPGQLVEPFADRFRFPQRNGGAERERLPFYPVLRDLKQRFGGQFEVSAERGQKDGVFRRVEIFPVKIHRTLPE